MKKYWKVEAELSRLELNAIGGARFDSREAAIKCANELRKTTVFLL